MPRLSLTDFVDIVSASGTPKATKVKQVKARPEYEPAFDYYKQLREAIVATHRSGGTRSQLERHLGEVRDPRKTDNFAAVLEGYRTWWGRKSMSWVEPPSEIYSRHGVEVSVNPELGLEINGRRHLVKIYFKADPLSKYRVDIITHLMEVCLRPQVRAATTMSVLDARRAKLFSPSVPVPGLDAALGGELAYVAALWGEV